jgi:hypothetical protein
VRSVSVFTYDHLVGLASNVISLFASAASLAVPTTGIVNRPQSVANKAVKEPTVKKRSSKKSAKARRKARTA